MTTTEKAFLAQHNLKRLRQLIAEARNPKPRPTAERTHVTLDEVFDHIARFEAQRRPFAFPQAVASC